MSARFKPLTKAVAGKLVARTLAELKADLTAAAAENQGHPGDDAHQARRRIGALEIALARVIGAVAGQAAEDELAELLDWGPYGGLEGEKWTFGHHARWAAERAVSEARRG